MPLSQPKVALIVIATGERYWPYIEPLVASAKKFFLPHHVFLFTDDDSFYDVHRMTLIIPKGYPLETLHRYHTVLRHWYLFEPYDYVFYVDVDALFVAPVGEEILADGITATRHAGYKPPDGAWETRQGTSSYVRPERRKFYFAGGFNGGRKLAYLNMALEIRAEIDCDAKQGIMPIWHDESALNRYLAFYEPAKVLSPAYCYPEPQFVNGPSEILEGIEPKILCLEKRWR